MSDVEGMAAEGGDTCEHVMPSETLIERVQADGRIYKIGYEEGLQIIPGYAMLDIWMALGHDSQAFDSWYESVGYAEAWAQLVGQVRASKAEAEQAWRSGYHTGKRDYVGSVMGGMSISTPNPYQASPPDSPSM